MEKSFYEKFIRFIRQARADHRLRQGIGYLLAEGLAEYGAEIIINDRTQQKADAAAQALRAQGYRATGVALMSPAASRLNRPLRGLRRRSGRLIF
jgi:gluconate 5-dehydrogenase